MACWHVQLSLLRPGRMASIHREGPLLRKTPQVRMAYRRVSTDGVRRARACGNSRGAFVVLLNRADVSRVVALT
jgi:hypothetical protein